MASHAPHRGKGVGETLMRGVLDVARSRGLREVWLEALFPYQPAIRLYEKLGFERVRVLEAWALQGVRAEGRRRARRAARAGAGADRP